MSRIQILKNFVSHRYVGIVCRLIVGGVFIAAGMLKITEPIESFIEIGRLWNIIPDPFLTWFMTALPWVELIFGVFVVLGMFTRFSASIIALCLLSFMIGIVVNMIRGRTLGECGCFGGAFDFGKSFTELLVRDVILMLFTLVIVFTKKTWLSLDNYLRKS